MIAPEPIRKYHLPRLQLASRHNGVEYWACTTTNPMLLYTTGFGTTKRAAYDDLIVILTERSLQKCAS